MTKIRLKKVWDRCLVKRIWTLINMVDTINLHQHILLLLNTKTVKEKLFVLLNLLIYMLKRNI